MSRLMWPPVTVEQRRTNKIKKHHPSLLDQHLTFAKGKTPIQPCLLLVWIIQIIDNYDEDSDIHCWHAIIETSHGQRLNGSVLGTLMHGGMKLLIDFVPDFDPVLSLNVPTGLTSEAPIFFDWPQEHIGKLRGRVGSSDEFLTSYRMKTINSAEELKWWTRVTSTRHKNFAAYYCFDEFKKPLCYVTFDGANMETVCGDESLLQSSKNPYSKNRNFRIELKPDTANNEVSIEYDEEMIENDHRLFNSFMHLVNIFDSIDNDGDIELPGISIGIF